MSKKSNQFYYAHYAQTSIKMPPHSKPSNQLPCLSNSGQRSHKIQNSSMTCKSPTSPNTWACKETCDGTYCIGWASMVFPWTLSSKSCRVRKPPFWYWKTRLALNLGDFALRSGFSASSFMARVITSCLRSEIATIARYGTLLGIIACTSSVIGRVLAWEVGYMAGASPSSWATTCGGAARWPPSVSIMRGWARQSTSNASTLRSGASNDPKVKDHMWEREKSFNIKNF